MSSQNYSKLRVSIVIPVYNEAEYLDACLQAISRQTVQPYEVIVVDNNSTDNSVAIARTYPFVKVLTEKRQGVVYARDRGFNAARGDVIGRIDGDTALEPCWVEKLQKIFEDRSVDAVSGFVCYFDVALEGVVDKVHAALRARIAQKMRPVFLWGANMAIRRSAWGKVRGTLCHEGAFHEDMDLAVHLGAAGKSITYDHSLHANASGRRIDMIFPSLARYIWANDRTYERHGIGLGQRRHMYPTMIVVLVFYPTLRLLYRGYDRQSRTFSLKRALAKPASYRLSPITIEK